MPLFAALATVLVLVAGTLGFLAGRTVPHSALTERLAEQRYLRDVASVDRDNLRNDVIRHHDAAASYLDAQRATYRVKRAAGAAETDEAEVMDDRENYNQLRFLSDRPPLAGLAEAAIEVVFDGDDRPRVVTSTRELGDRSEVTRYYLEEDGTLFLAVRTRATPVAGGEDRWYFLADEYVTSRAVAPPDPTPLAPGERRTTFWYVLDGEVDLAWLREELASALARVDVVARAQRNGE
ncbi:MAG TPA: hypothetical protein VNA69_10085 [Thermoanaerobaculia bacterium]|nr:hypothetical protein [Thermoanaerobaculia bacterium]